MARIQKTSYSDSFVSLKRNAEEIDERNDCSVVALSVASNRMYSEIRELLKFLGRKDRAGVSHNMMYAAIARLGFRGINVDPKEIIARFPKPHCDVLKNFTSHHPRRFPGCMGEGTFLVWTAGHVFCVKDGVVHDWSVNKSLRAYKIMKLERH